MGGGFQLREVGRPMPLPSTGRGPLPLPRCSAASTSADTKLPLALRPAALGDRRPAMMCGDSGAGATAGRGSEG